ncbi:MAG: pyridoxal-phosphate dependent enzyme, partial [Nitrospinota bacterium]
MGFVLGLKCKECGKEYPKEPIHVCDYCFGPLEIVYDYDAMRKVVSRESIQAGPQSIWRYKALLPIDGEPAVGLNVGMTPLVRVKRLGAALGLRNLYVKNDSVCCPTLSFKDRVVAVAVTKAREFGFDTVACASTGNLANSVAAHAAEAGLKSVIFIPADLEMGKIIGTLVYRPTLVGVSGVYDDVNRLCSEIASNYPWA